LNLQKLAQKQERLSFIGQTASELAHEIKNPLAIIKSSADVLQKRIDPEKKDLALNFIASETMRLSRTIDRVLNFASNKPLQKVFFNLHDILKLTTEPLKVKWPEIEFDLLDDNTIELNGDKDAFQQILWNLIKNSAEAMNGKGKISICFVSSLLMFQDNGPGVPSELRKSLFEPFVTAKASGTGLGLAVVAALCEKHGWKIALDSKHINGAAFMIKLPEESWRKS
jgi:nitrogen-specific signal transduction histidine kinase